MTTKDLDLPDDGRARRQLLRGGALAIGAAGALGLSSQSARAATGDPIVAGQVTTATTGTGLTANLPARATLTLTNNSGPSLRLPPTTADPTKLNVGDVINRELGPDIVVNRGSGPEMGWLVTDYDLPPGTIAFAPLRVMDTRDASFHSLVVKASTPSWYDSSKRVKSGVWIDVPVAMTEEGLDLHAVYLNLTTTGSSRRGHMTVSPSGQPTPTASNLQYPAGATLANLCFVAPALVGDRWCVRVKVSAASHVILDLSGAVGYFPHPSAAAAGTGATATASARLSVRGHQRASALRAGIVRGLRLED